MPFCGSFRIWEVFSPSSSHLAEFLKAIVERATVKSPNAVVTFVHEVAHQQMASAVAASQTVDFFFKGCIHNGCERKVRPVYKVTHKPSEEKQNTWSYSFETEGIISD